MGPEADAFVDWAASAGQGLWQVLPLGPTGHHDSPYYLLSAFAGNPLLISPERLVEDGFLPASAIADEPDLPHDAVDYQAAGTHKERLLRASYAHFSAHAPESAKDELTAFERAPEQEYWLADWTLYAALLAKHEGSWTAWPRELVHQEAWALAAARAELSGEVAYQEYLQFLFFRQWARLKSHASARGVTIFGDVPIYLAHGSADVFAHQELFVLDADGKPEAVAGVPPDYFSETGQLWGNPLYRWDAMERDGYRWWIERLRLNLRLADLVRVDHFRGFASYWEVPAGEETAIHGRWVAGPGTRLFDALAAALGALPIVAEDLGIITAEVETLLEAVGFPGMKVLQFAFSEDDNGHLPHNHPRHSVVYTGTHDNPTVRGWWTALDAAARDRVAAYLGHDGDAIDRTLLRAAYTSVAERVIVPVQDVFGLGPDATMNVPGRAEGNWRFRAKKSLFTQEAAERLASLARLTGRAPA
jgi:4-alpha-glucanotransferase